MALPKIIRLLALIPFLASAQNYTAVNGSSYIGSLNVHSNPAAIVNSPFKWDMTLVGLQDKNLVKGITVFNYSLLSNPGTSEYRLDGGRFKRSGDINLNLNLLNTRIALNRRMAIAFGANFKSYTTLRTSEYNFYDTLDRFRDFFVLNEGEQNLQLDFATSSWLELFGTFAMTIKDDYAGRLNAGITLKVNRGLSGAFAQLSRANFRILPSGPPNYEVTGADLEFGYSWNYDAIDSTKSSGQNLRSFTSNTEGGASVDIGLEYLIKLPGGYTQAEEEESYYDYDWKIGLSLLDVGYSQYHYGQYSTVARNLRTGITDLLLDQKFDSTVNSLKEFKDSLSSLYTDAGTQPGVFRINHPTRLVLNVDKFINGAFFINADISLPLNTPGGQENKYVRDISRITVTPRWETRRKGFYMPVYYNSLGQVWVGGGIRLGPVLFGVHNWANIFSKNKIQQGGGYLAIIIKPGSVTGSRGDRRLDCYW